MRNDTRHISNITAMKGWLPMRECSTLRGPMDFVIDQGSGTITFIPDRMITVTYELSPVEPRAKIRIHPTSPRRSRYR